MKVNQACDCGGMPTRSCFVVNIDTQRLARLIADDLFRGACVLVQILGDESEAGGWCKSEAVARVKGILDRELTKND